MKITCNADGSFVPDTGDASFGVYLIFETEDDIRFEDAIYGGICTDPRNRFFIGAHKKSAHIGECAAIAEALRLCSRFPEPLTEIEIRYDCTSAAPNMRRGCGNLIARYAYFLLQRLRRKGVMIRWTWIKGHAGDLGNEVAGRLAAIGAQEQRALPQQEGEDSEFEWAKAHEFLELRALCECNREAALFNGVHLCVFGECSFNHCRKWSARDFPAAWIWSDDLFTWIWDGEPDDQPETCPPC